MSGRKRAILVAVAAVSVVTWIWLVAFSPRVTAGVREGEVVVDCRPVWAGFNDAWVLGASGGAIDARVVEGEAVKRAAEQQAAQRGVADPFLIQRELDRACTNRRAAISTVAAIPAALAVAAVALLTALGRRTV